MRSMLPLCLSGYDISTSSATVFDCRQARPYAVVSSGNAGEDGRPNAPGQAVQPANRQPTPEVIR